MTVGSSRVIVQRFVWLAVLWSLGAPTGHAANWLTEVVQYDVDDDHHEVEIVLGESLTLTERFETSSQRVFKSRAVAGDDAPREGWQYSELSFDEDDSDLKKVSVEGSVDKGFEVTLEFHRPVYVMTLPRYSPNRLSFLHSSEKKFRSLTRFSGNSDLEFGPVAVRFTLGGRFSVDAIPFEIARHRRVYRPPENSDELRVGFYATRTAANVVLRELRGVYPDADLVYVSAAEVEYAKHFNLFTERVIGNFAPADAPANAPGNEGTLAAARTSLPKVTMRAVTPATIDLAPKPEPKPIEWTGSLDRSALDQAREAYLDQDFDRAIALYTKAAEEPRLREEALEMLGVTREKNRQLAHAKSEYERFLHAYPDTEAADRVRQRLDSLVGNTRGIAELHEAREPASAAWHVAGSLSQFYRRQSIEIDNQDEIVPMDAVFSDMTAIVRRHSANATHEARASVGHVVDLSERDDSRTLRAHRIYWDSFFEKYNFGVRLGRQSRSNSGILGRFDGVTATYRQNDNLRWNVIGGYVADSTFNDFSTSRPIYGVNADIVLLDGSATVSPFFVQQERDGVLDRQAVGVHAFYVSEKTTLTVLTDYDVHHQSLNNLYLTGSYNLNDEWRITSAYDLRRSPYLTTSNALIGQGFEDLSELERSLIDLELEDIAEDRTATSNLARFGIDGNLNDTWFVSVDASMSEISETDTSLGVNGLDDRSDFYMTAQVRANDLLMERSYTAVQMRYMKSDSSETTMGYLTTRLSWHDWLVHARLVASQRTFGTSDQEQRQLRPSMRFEYRGFGRLKLEFEVGYDWTTRETVARDVDMKGLYVHLGYRTLF